MAHGDRPLSPRGSRDVLHTHSGGDCSVYKVMFSTSSRDYVPDLDLETKFSLISTLKGWITPSPNHFRLFELNWIEFSQVISAIKLRMMSECSEDGHNILWKLIFWVWYILYKCIRNRIVEFHNTNSFEICIQFLCLNMHANNNDYPHPPSSQNLEIGLIEDKSILIVEILTFLLGQCRPFCSDKYRVSFFLMEFCGRLRTSCLYAPPWWRV